MSKIKRFWLVAVLLLAVLPVSAGGFKFGPRVGLNVNSLHFNKELYSSSNRAGFTAGLQAEFIVPIIGVGCDLSVMYVRRTHDWMQDNNIPQAKKKDYIDIPLNLKYKLSLPAISNIVAPYVFTGPDFAILASKKAVVQAVEAKSFNVSWNFGFGVELIKHLQLSASYGIGLNKPLKFVGVINNPDDLEKNKYWTVTAAWLF